MEIEWRPFSLLLEEREATKWKKSVNNRGIFYSKYIGAAYLYYRITTWSSLWHFNSHKKYIFVVQGHDFLFELYKSGDYYLEST